MFIAAYHYFRIFNNWEADFTSLNAFDGAYSPTGLPFNHAYRYHRLDAHRAACW